jgi:hypothetical protein
MTPSTFFAGTSGITEGETLKSFLNILYEVAQHFHFDVKIKIQNLKTIDTSNLKILESYGCAIVCSDESYGVAAEPHISIHLIALDPWAFDCSKKENSSFLLSSRCRGYQCLPVGTIDLQTKKLFFGKFTDLLSLSSKKPGHQKTPGFILSILYDVLLCSSSFATSSLAGFTDVGSHSGQVPARKTRWELIKALAKHLLLSQNKVTDHVLPC